MYILPMLSSVAFADQATQSPDIAKGIEGISKFNTMMIECELDYACLLKNLDLMVTGASDKTEKTFFQFVYDSLNERKQVMTEFSEQCKIEPVKSVRDSKIICLKALNAELAKHTGSDQAKIANDTCMLEQLKPKADDANIFAMMLLIEHYQKNNNIAERDRLENALLKQQDKPEFKLLDKCFY